VISNPNSQVKVDSVEVAGMDTEHKYLFGSCMYDLKNS
jgi:hypothetical protein